MGAGDYERIINYDWPYVKQPKYLWELKICFFILYIYIYIYIYIYKTYNWKTDVHVPYPTAIFMSPSIDKIERKVFTTKCSIASK